MSNTLITTATAIIALRESRMVLPKTLPRPYRRLSCFGWMVVVMAAMSGCLHRLVSVFGEEGLLEGGLATDEVGELVRRRGPDDRGDRPAHTEVHRLVG